MSSSVNKTVATAASVDAFIEAVQDPRQREDARFLQQLMEHISGSKAAMWGPSIIGFGRYHYRYDSGREGEMCRIGFSPRKGQTVIYIVDGFPGHADLLARLGNHKTGKSCLYIKRLADVDGAALDALLRASWAEMASRYPLDGAR